MPRKANNEKTTKIERNFGNEREFGEVFKNTETGKISATLNVGFFSKKNCTSRKRRRQRL